MLYLKKLSNDYNGDEVTKEIGSYEFNMKSKMVSPGVFTVKIKKTSLKTNKLGSLLGYSNNDVSYQYAVIVDKKWMFCENKTAAYFDCESICVEVKGKSFEEVGDFNMDLVRELITWT